MCTNKHNSRYKYLLIIALAIVVMLSGCKSSTDVEKKYPDINIANIKLSLEEKKFLSEHHYNIDETKSILENCSDLDADIKDYDIFLAGEDHIFTANSKVELALLKYLVEKGDIKYFIPEVSYSQGYLLDKYLATGDTTAFKYLPDEPLQIDRWMKINDYYKSLPENKRFKIIGLDIENNTGDGADCMYYIISKCKNIDTIPLLKEFVKNHGSGKYDEYYNGTTRRGLDSELYKFCISLRNEIKDKKDKLEEVLGNNLFDISIINEGIITSFEAYNQRDKTGNESVFWPTRENQIEKNFLMVYNHYAKGKYFGEWGGNHTSLDKYPFEGSFNNFANYINTSDTDLKNKVLSFTYFYSYVPLHSNIYNIFAAFTEDNENAALFKIAGTNSPFQRFKMGDLYDNIVDSRYPTEFYQYCIIVKKSDIYRR
jgi:hypothetical protein